MPYQEHLRHVPSVDSLLQSTGGQTLIAHYGHDATRDAIRQTLDNTRQAILSGHDAPLTAEQLLESAQQHLETRFLPTLRPVVNATGVILHTNLGRAPLSQSTIQAMQGVGGQYNNLEFNLDTGKRGSRLIHAEGLLQDLTGAESALVVNNAASALVLLLSALAKDREVILSRGQLVEIGGGFRIPDIMAQSGARLVEVGTTNRTRIGDYRQVITEETALLMRVHSSNFKQIGFTESASLAELADLAHEHGLWCVDDLGSGALLDTADFGLAHEPTVQESLSAGADLIVFSGDKLLGGPQAGILLGKQVIIDQLKRLPLARALRVDKLIYGALCATLDHYRKGEATTHIPIWQMMSRSLDELETIVQRWAEQTGGQVMDGESAVGGGSLPGTTLPTKLLAFEVDNADEIMSNLRQVSPPIIARVADGQLLFDPRTILEHQEAHLLSTLQALL